MKVRACPVCLIAVLCIAGCSSDDTDTPSATATDHESMTSDTMQSSSDETVQTDTDPTTSLSSTTATVSGPTDSLVSSTASETPAPSELLDYPQDCEPLQTSYCAFPWPSSLFLEEDESRGSGYTVRFGEDTLPGNMRPDAYTRMDGFGLGSPIMTLFPRLDGSALPGEFAVGDSMANDAQILLYRVDDDSLERVPYWAELDAQENNAARKTLFVRPATILQEDTRYIVAMRNLQDLDGEPIPASTAFELLRDAETANVPSLAPRQERFNEIFSLLDGEGVDTDELILAWDFHTASTDGLHRIMLHMRDDGFERVGDAGPELSVESVQSWHPSGTPDVDPNDTHPHIAYQVEGTFEAPHYMREREIRGETGYVFELEEDGLPSAEGTRSVDFLVRIPHSATDGTPHGIITYGHGLLGSRFEIRADHIGRIADEYNWIIVSADLVGMSSQDFDVLQEVLSNLTNFTVVTDRLHQGLLEYMLLTRATRERLEDTLDAADIDVTIDQEKIAYFGGSQGGIFGGTYAALSPDVEHSFLAVPGNNYATLLQRSTNFAQFAGILSAFYNPRFEFNTALAAIQLLWDGTDPVSYVRRISHDPFPGQDPRRALFALAKADWQVSVATNENVARAGIDIPVVGTWDRELEPWNVDQVAYPHEGSGIVLYDFGNPWPEGRANRPPDDDLGDPHSLHATIDEVGDQLDFFLRDGEIIDVCGDSLCYFPRNEE